MKDNLLKDFTPKDVSRFMTKLKTSEKGCWEYSGYQDDHGYCRFRFGKYKYLPHRVMWTVINDIIPTGLVVRHKCDNSICCNPDHLELGTVADNNRDAFERGRHVSHYAGKTHCHLGHEFTIENTRIGQNKNVKSGSKIKRSCRQCDTINNRKKVVI